MERKRHKESNRFKFIPFSERISQINVDVFHRVPHRNEDEDGEETFFNQAIQKWTVLNLTKEWTEFRKEACQGGIRQLTQLLNRKEQIAKLFVVKIPLQNELSLQPVLECLIAFVKDLRREFYPFYFETLKELIKLLKIHNPVILESSFVCLAYIFKYLCRDLVKDLDKVLVDLAPLLNDNIPDYVQDFAAQSFAFVARRLKDPEKFLKLVLHTVQTHPSLTMGCGKLYFETMYGINGQPHSTSKDTLKCLFKGFNNPSYPKKVLMVLSSYIVTTYISKIKPDYSNFFSTLVESNREILLGGCFEKQRQLKSNLKLALLALNYQQGAHLRDPLLLMEFLFELDGFDECKLLVVELCGKLLTLKNIRLSQEVASRIISKMLQQSKEFVICFIEQISDCNNFEGMVLPFFLELTLNPDKGLDQTVLMLLSKIIFKKTNPSWKLYPLFLPITVPEQLLDFILNAKFPEDLETVAGFILLLPHVKNLDSNQILEVLLKLTPRILPEIEDRNFLFLLTIIMECLTLLEPKPSIDWNTIPNIKSSMMAFKAVQYVTELISNYENMEDIIKETVDLLKSPYHKTRTTALQILINLTKTNERLNDVLKMCLEIEMVPLTVQDYRQAVKVISKLHSTTINLPDQLAVIPLKYLLGILFCNFKLLWEPICEAITSYATSMAHNEFWLAFYPQLQLFDSSHDSNLISDDLLPQLKSEFLIEKARELVSCDERVDYFNYKSMIWKISGNFYNVCEAKNRDIVPMIIDFIRSNLLKKSTEHSSSCNIKENDISLIIGDENKIPTVSCVKIAVAQLELLAQFRNLRQTYKEPELRGLLLDLLLHKNVEIQSGALKCLLSYRWPYLTPYKDHLLNLVDEQKFKDELVYFKIDKDGGVVKDIHRKDIMPIVLRILHSKMLSKVSSAQRGNKGSALSLRRSLVLRFLAGCHNGEMDFFLRMAFRLLENTSDPLETMKSIDLDHIIHPKKLRSIINLATVVLEHFGGLMTEELKKFLLHVILTTAAIVSGALRKKDQIHVGFISSLKSLRSSCVETLITFFEKFDTFPWTEEDIEAVFQICVWPVLEKLSIEALHNPTPLLKLLESWSKNPRYFVLLCRHLPQEESKTPLASVMQLVLEKQCKPSVISVINSILEHLLTLKEEEGDSMETDLVVPPLQLENIRPVDEATLKQLELKDELNFGTRILLPHIASILDHLRRQIESNQKKGLNKTEALILSRITELATSPQHADALLHLLLKTLTGKPLNDEEILINTLQTVQNLFKVVSQPKNYLRSVAELFGNIEPIAGRRVLLNCLHDIALILEDVKPVAELITLLNAFDKRWVDQCDINKRLDALKSVRILVENGSIDIQTGLFVMHNCFFFIKYEKDFSLRDSTDHTIKQLTAAILKLVTENQFNREYFTEAILKFIRKGIVVMDDDRYRVSCIELLGHLARTVPETHYIFQDLSVLTNKEDSEVDFFENINHLQIYRRTRALLRFCSVIKTVKKPISARTLTQFVLPLVTHFLCNEKFTGKNSLVDAAIECVGVVSRLLPWHQYQAILNYYLLKLRTKVDFQKQCIRIIIGILDNFAFDISKAENVEQLLNNNDDPSESLEEKTEIMEKESLQKNDADKQDDLLEALMDDQKMEVLEDARMEVEDEIPIYNKMKILGPSAAARVKRAISGSLLTQLYRVIGERTAIDEMHKINKKNLGPDRDEEDILRVPIAITLVKLLQKLPGDLLDTQLPGLFMKLCTFLKSRLESVRRVTKETLQEIMKTLGPKKLGSLYKEMTGLLKKGFHVHVLVFTMHAVMQSVQNDLQPGDIDKLLPTILEVCSRDLFGSVSEEKEIVQIQVKHSEARAVKSFNFLHLLAQYVTENCLMDLILPIKQALSTTHSHKMMTKCRECLRQIAMGLALNKFVSLENLFQFIYGIVSESIPELVTHHETKERKENRRGKADCFLLPPEPKSRIGVLSNPVKNTGLSSVHIVIEFGFHLLMLLIKHEKIKSINALPFLDPLIPVLNNALQSQHVKISSLSVQCLSRLLKYDLSNFKIFIKSITDTLFSILHKFAAAGMSKGDNYELVMAAFKAVSVIVRHVDYHSLTEDQLKILLLYAEEDMQDSMRQAVAFNLLKSILHKKLKVAELHGVMQKVAELSITSQLEHVRVQARQTVLQYIMDYFLGKKLEKLIGFYLSQLNYSEDFGRLSALEMIFSFVNSFPQDTLNENSGIFLVTLGARLVNDDNIQCKKMVSAILKTMILKLESTNRDKVFDLVLVWLKNSKAEHRRLAAQLAGIFVSSEKSDFSKRLPTLLPLIINELQGDQNPGSYVRAVSDDCEVKMKDHKTFQILQLVLKICQHCPEFLSNSDYWHQIRNLNEISQSLLCHSHEWVRLAASQFLGSVFNSVKPNFIAQCLNGNEKIVILNQENLSDQIKSLILDHCAQLIPGVTINPELVDQITKNLVYFAKVLKDVKTDEDYDRNINLLWLIKRMRRIVNLEVAQAAGTYTLRMAVFKWIAAVSISLSPKELEAVLYHLIAPLVREEEVGQNSAETPLSSLTREVMKTIKKRIGVEVFAQEAVKIQSKLLEKRAERKTKRAQEFVVDPVKANKRKLEEKERKKEMKKRKIQKLSGKKFSKKRKK